MRKIIFALTLMLFAEAVSASKNFVLLINASTVDKILRAIPASKNNLGAVLLQYGLSAESILISEPDEFDMNGSPMVQKGDRFIDINLKEPLPRVSNCPLYQPISFTVRNGKYIPMTSTASFLTSGVCSVPSL